MTRPARADAETLRALHVAHLRAFPFHNLAIQRHGAVPLDVESITRKFLDRDGGGYCFEQNTLLAAVLRELGFHVTELLARVGPPDRRFLNHMLLRVDIDGEAWLADVGFGGEGFIEPLPLREATSALQCGIAYTLRRDGDYWTLLMHCADQTEEMYEFSTLRHTANDVEMANYFTATHPSSIFRRTLSIQRATPEERLVLRPSVITRYTNSGRVNQPIESSELRHYARELFAVDLGNEPLLFEELTTARV